MRSLLTTFAVLVLLMVGPSLEAWGELGQNAVYLEDDEQGRYRPTIENDGHGNVLADIDSITPPALSPDGTRVAFSGALGNGSLGRFALYLVDADGSDLEQITGGDQGEFDPVWIDDGEGIIFSQNTSGSILSNSCCRLVSYDVDSGTTDVLTLSVGAIRPAAAPSGEFVYWDNPAGVWRIRTVGGSATLIAPGGFDAAVSADEKTVAFLHLSGSSTQLRRTDTDGGGSTLLYSTTNQLENPVFVNDRIFFTEFGGLGYDGRQSIAVRSIHESGGSARTEATYPSGVVGVTPGKSAEEIFFYRDDGLFRYYDIRPDGSLPSPMVGGSNYTRGWSSITSVNLDGDSDDEMFFYRDDGLFRYYQVRPDGTIPKPSSAGDHYTRDWSAITAVDLDGDGQDEMFFYRFDGLYRYYEVRTDGSIPLPLRAGSDYTNGWTSIVAVDLDGDGQDEMFFYRDDGLYRFYGPNAGASLGPPISEGDDFQTGLAWVAAIDLDGDSQDELLLYRDDGSYEYRDVSSNGVVGDVIRGGNEYTSGWSIITSLRLGPR
ncbi:MAG TPA: FG-GAP-like repeat-containing protein [Acidimicrobiia bacterium]|nr:FG-GAP-like repeat-containing protein [Acidimicrobiia bacterium]